MKYTILFLLMMAFTIYAQDSYSTIQFNAGIGIPGAPQEFVDYWNTSINFGAGYSHYFNASFSIQGNFEYDLFTLDDEVLLTEYGLNYSGITLDGGNVSTIYVSGDVQYNLINVTHQFSPYIFAGLGFFHLSTANTTLDDGFSSEEITGDSENALGIDFGAGVQLNVAANFSIYGEAKYITAFTKDERTNYIPLRLGGMFWF